MNDFKIAETNIGMEESPYFIAEIGSNFDGSLTRAKDLICMAKESGAHAAKFQHYTAETLVSNTGFRDLGGAIGHQKSWNKSVLDVYRQASLNLEWTAELSKTCKEVGIHFMTSPYSLELVDLVDEYVPAFKIGSGDITWPAIIDLVSRKNKPVLLATGASSLEDVIRAMKIIKKNNTHVVLMQCNTNYIVDKHNLQYQNLRVLELYKLMFPDVILGLSDHTLGDLAVLGAYVLGARVFEKHFTDDRSRSGPDHKFATEPHEFKEMVNKVKELRSLLGSCAKSIEANELDSKIVQRRSIHASRDIGIGEVLTLDDFVYLRPCPDGSIPPYMADSLVGRKAKSILLAGQTIKLMDVE